MIIGLVQYMFYEKMDVFKYLGSKMNACYLGIHCVRIRFKRRFDATGLHPPPVDRVEPGMNLDLHHTLPTSRASKSVGWSLLQQSLAQRSESRC